MANSQAYNDFYRDLDLIAGEKSAAEKAAGISIGQPDFLLRVAFNVQEREFAMSKALGADTLLAHMASWEAYDDVMAIGTKAAPTIYQTTEAKMITGRVSS